MLMLVEEIHIHRHLTTQTHEIPVLLRSEHAEIQRDADFDDTPAATERV
jgi:stress response protein YsnF